VYGASAAAQLRTVAHADFAAAAARTPGGPDPHLALARFCVYAQPDVDRAMQEFATARQLGARMGRREIEQQGDAYRMRAEREARRRPGRARSDAQMAKAFYERIGGFDQAGVHLRELARMRYGAGGSDRRGRRWR
jgi:hypothetical protein